MVQQRRRAQGLHCKAAALPAPSHNNRPPRPEARRVDPGGARPGGRGAGRNGLSGRGGHWCARRQGGRRGFCVVAMPISRVQRLRGHLIPQAVRPTALSKGLKSSRCAKWCGGRWLPDARRSGRRRCEGRTPTRLATAFSARAGLRGSAAFLRESQQTECHAEHERRARAAALLDIVKTSDVFFKTSALVSRTGWAG